MNRKWVGVVVAVALAAAGTWVLVTYVRGAEDRALEGQETVAVLVVDSVVPAGTAAEDVGANVHVELVPTKVQASGSLGDLEALGSLEGLVTSVDLLPGEQVIAARFVTLDVLDDQDRVAIPEGMVEVTLSMSPERAVGGVLRTGDRVDVIASFSSQSVGTQQVGTTTDPGSPTLAVETPDTTAMILQSVLVTNVQVEELPRTNTSEGSNTSTLEFSPSGPMLVTFAMEPADAERFVFTAEFGTVWLADAARVSDEATTNIQDRSTVYDDSASGS